MIKKLQHKFILISMLSVFAVMVLVIGSINLINVYYKNTEQNQMLEYISQNDGHFRKLNKFPNNTETTTSSESTTSASESQTNTASTQTTTESANFGNGGGNGSGMGLGLGKGSGNQNNSLMPQEPNNDDMLHAPKMNAETQYKTRFFTVKTDTSGNVTEFFMDNIAAVDEDKAKEYADNILKSGSVSGSVGVYKYIVANKDYGKLLIFLDCNDDTQASMNILFISLCIGLISLLIVLLLVSVFSRRAIKPFAESIEKQKRFITDASHEIKTPLAIISANADVLSITDGENEWISSIQNQTQRLSGLVNNLVSLAKLDEEKTQLTFSPFNVSDAVLDAAVPFETMASSVNKSISYNVESDITFNGNEGAIRQLCALLVDNAVKYSPENNEINIALYKKNKLLHFEVKNKSDEISKETLNKLFDRFYRSDESRARKDDEKKGGYGIGLSIAQAITVSHKGKISADYKDGYITFSVLLPM